MKIGEFELNKIYCMYCFDGLKKIPDKSVDLVVTDPPYNTGMVKKELEKNQKAWLSGFFNDNYTDVEYLQLIKDTCSEIYRVLKENLGIYIYMNWFLVRILNYNLIFILTIILLILLFIYFFSFMLLEFLVS